MTLLALLFFCFLPPAIWALYCVVSLRFSPARAAFAVLVALVALVAAVGVRLLLEPPGASSGSHPSPLFSAFALAAGVEELCKLGAVRLVAGIWLAQLPRKGSDDAFSPGSFASPRLILAAAILVGVSFSAFETLVYSVRNPSILWLRSLTALPVHASAGLLGGRALFAAARGTRNGTAGFSPLYLVAGIAFHGVYTACMEAGRSFVPLALAAVLGLVVLAFLVWNGFPGQDSAEDGDGGFSDGPGKR